MVSVRSGLWTIVGCVLLLGLCSPTWAVSANPGNAHGSKWRQGLACAVPAVDPEQRSRWRRPVVSNCAPPPVFQPPSPSHEGYRPIEWHLYPGEPSPGPSSRSIVVAVHEAACTGGRDPIPHLQGPEVSYQRGAVVITLWIEVLEGPHTCPGNPIGRLEVKLPGPLGARQLYDGSTDPPRKVEPGEDPRRFPRR
jgi:hypothetical protein